MNTVGMPRDLQYTSMTDFGRGGVELNSLSKQSQGRQDAELDKNHIKVG